MQEPPKRRRTSRGVCALCKAETGKAQITRHLEKHLAEKDAAPGLHAARFHLRVEGAYSPEYWLHLDVRADATLDTLDTYLRRIWLECCGHLSAFTIGETRYEDTRLDPGEEEEDEEGSGGDLAGLLPAFFRPPTKRMTVPLAQALTPGLVFRHEYDFGSTTELKIRVLSAHVGDGTEDAVLLLARNVAPETLCENCEQPAVWLGVDEEGEYRELCGKCAKRMKLDEWLLPVVNSPRAGVCGYEGPAER